MAHAHKVALWGAAVAAGVGVCVEVGKGVGVSVGVAVGSGVNVGAGVSATNMGRKNALPFELSNAQPSVQLTVIAPA